MAFDRYHDIGMITGIEGGDPSYAVAVLDFCFADSLLGVSVSRLREEGVNTRIGGLVGAQVEVADSGITVSNFEPMPDVTDEDTIASLAADE